MQIVYKHIKNGYVRIKEWELLIIIPAYKKWSNFEKIMIAKWEKFLSRYNKKNHVIPIRKESILLFGEEITLEEFYQQYPQKKWIPSQFNISTFPHFNILKEILREYTTPIFDLYSKKLWIPYKSIIFRKTSSKRWSCTHDQKFSLNLDLIHLPTKYIKYVIIHECCHLKVKNHSKKFRSLVETFAPNYKETKKELRKFIIR